MSEWTEYADSAADHVRLAREYEVDVLHDVECECWILASADRLHAETNWVLAIEDLLTWVHGDGWRP